MPAYCIVDVCRVKDPAKMEEYKSRVPETVEAHGGRYLAAGGATEVMEGDWTPSFPVLIEFPSLEALRLWYDSEAYRPLKRLRHEATDCDMVFVDGLEEGA